MLCPALEEHVAAGFHRESTVAKGCRKLREERQLSRPSAVPSQSALAGVVGTADALGGLAGAERAQASAKAKAEAKAKAKAAKAEAKRRAAAAHGAAGAE